MENKKLWLVYCKLDGSLAVAGLKESVENGILFLNTDPKPFFNKIIDISNKPMAYIKESNSEDIKLSTMKIVINKDCGGFGISRACYNRMRELGYPEDEYTKEIDSNTDDYIYLGPSYTMRNHPALVQAVEELGSAANGRYACLRIAEIPDDISWYISDYDGVETLHEEHRRW